MARRLPTGIAVAIAMLTVGACDGNGLFATGPILITQSEGGSGRDSIEFDEPTASIYAIGIYEGGSNHSAGYHPTEVVTVEIEKAEGEPIQLAVSSFEPTLWTVTGPGAGRVNAVYIDGHHRHSVQGLSNGARVVNTSGPNRSTRAPLGEGWGNASALADGGHYIGCAYTYPGPSGGGCEAGAAFVANAEAYLKGKVRSFSGIYNAQSFRITE